MHVISDIPLSYFPHCLFSLDKEERMNGMANRLESSHLSKSIHFLFPLPSQGQQRGAHINVPTVHSNLAKLCLNNNTHIYSTGAAEHFQHKETLIGVVLEEYQRSQGKRSCYPHPYHYTPHFPSHIFTFSSSLHILPSVYLLLQSYLTLVPSLIFSVS